MTVAEELAEIVAEEIAVVLKTQSDMHAKEVAAVRADFEAQIKSIPAPTVPALPDTLVHRGEVAAAARHGAKHLLAKGTDVFLPPAVQPPTAPVTVHVHVGGGTRKTIEMVNARGELSSATVTED